MASNINYQKSTTTWYCSSSSSASIICLFYKIRILLNSSRRFFRLNESSLKWTIPCVYDLLSFIPFPRPSISSIALRCPSPCTLVLKTRFLSPAPLNLLRNCICGNSTSLITPRLLLRWICLISFEKSRITTGGCFSFLLSELTFLRRLLYWLLATTTIILCRVLLLLW